MNKKLISICIIYLIMVSYIVDLNNIIDNPVEAFGSGDYPPPILGDWLIDNITYVENETIILNGNLTILGEGNLTFRNVTLKMNCSENGTYHIEVHDGGEFYIYDNDDNNLTMNDASLITSNNPDGLHRYTFWVRQNSTFIMKNSILSECGNGTFVPDQGFFIQSNNSIIENNLITNNFKGIIISQATNILIANNTIELNDHLGIDIDRSSNIFIIKNKISNNSGGIYASFSPNMTIIHNTLTNNTLRGISYLDSRDLLIRDNIIINHSQAGIDIQRSENITITQNRISQSRVRGIYLVATSPLISRNYLSYNNHGIAFYARCNATLENNTIVNSTEYDIQFTEPIVGFGSHPVAINTSFNKSKVYYRNTESSLTVKWFMHVRVIDFSNNPVQAAMVEVKDLYGMPITSGFTDSNGYLKWIVSSEYIQNDTNGDYDGEDPGERIFYTPHNITISKNGDFGYADPVMDKSKIVVVKIGTHIYLLPPTNLTTKTVNDGNDVELEWDPPLSPNLDHYLIYRADSAMEFDFTIPYNNSLTWADPLNTTWIDPDPPVTMGDDYYYIIRAANSDETDISLTSNTAGVWTRLFQAGTSSFSLPLEPFSEIDAEFLCQNMNASFIRWMNSSTHTWMKHQKGASENNTLIQIGKGYEILFMNPTRYTFSGMPGAMILYDNISFGFDADPITGNANSINAVADSNSVTLSWSKPATMGTLDKFRILRSDTRDGFWGILDLDYIQIADLSWNKLSYQDIGNVTASSEFYYMVMPVNSSTAEPGISSYSIGVWTSNDLVQYDTLGLPLKPMTFRSLDWFCDDNPNVVGINYHLQTNQRWSWHSSRMPSGAFDPILEIAAGYQISTSDSTKYTFTGF